MSTDYQHKVFSVLRELGIEQSYGVKKGLSLQLECENLVAAGLDVFERETFMEEQTHTAWENMCTAALKDGIELQLVSAFRDVDYQKNLFLRKLAAGLSIDEILQVNAAPGYSEHHTGRALDLTCPGSDCLEESFETTEAFQWLSTNAGGFGFLMSFPRGNQQGFLYEPWHWFFSEQ